MTTAEEKTEGHKTADDLTVVGEVVTMQEGPQHFAGGSDKDVASDVSDYGASDDVSQSKHNLYSEVAQEIERAHTAQDLAKINEAIRRLDQDKLSSAFPLLTAATNGQVEGACADMDYSTHLVENIGGARTLESAFHIVRALRVRRRTGDVAPHPAYDEVGTAALEAVTQDDEGATQAAYKHMIELIQERFKPIENEFGANPTERWDLIARYFRPFCFTTCTVTLCTCEGSSAEDPVQRTHISTEGYAGYDDNLVITTVSEVCKQFFAKHQTHTTCEICGSLRTSQIVVLDRLPMHFMMEWPCFDITEVWDLDSVTHALEFDYTIYDHGTATRHVARPTTKTVRAILGIYQAFGAAHVQGFLSPRGLSGPVYLNDSTDGIHSLTLQPNEIKAMKRAMVGIVVANQPEYW